MSALFPPTRLRALLLVSVAALALSACATTNGRMAQTDFSGQPPERMAATLNDLAARYKAHPRDKSIVITYAAALRATNEPEQAASVVESGLAAAPNDIDLKIAYAKALAAAGRFDQALNVIEAAIDPGAPDWNALLVKGAILDQSGHNAEARPIYQQALKTNPNSAQLEANLGLSYAMTDELDSAEAHLKRAVGLPGATSQIRQNYALVVGLQGRFTEAQQLFARELPPDQVDANMNYIRSLLTQQNRWDQIKNAT